MRRTDEKALLKITLALADAAIIAAGVLLAYWLRFHLPFFPPPPEADFGTYVRFSVFLAFVGFVTLYNAGMYRLQQPFFGIDNFFSLVKTSTLAHLIAAAVGFAIRGRIPGDPVETYSRIVIVVSWLLVIILLTFWRLGFDIILTAMRRRGRALTRVMIIGDGGFGRAFHTLLRENPELGYLPTGLLDHPTPSVVGASLRQSPVDEVMIAAGDAEPSYALSLMGACQEARVQLSMVPSLFNMVTSQIRVKEVAGVPIFSLEERIFLRSSRVLKRAIDLAVAGLSLLVLSPLIGIVAALIWVESRGPVIFSHTRVGKRAQPFTLMKFRSMRQDAEETKSQLSRLNEAEGPLFKIRNDPRVTKVGRFIRKFSIDELPQLVNVIRGDMSLVGPRPPLPSEVSQYEPWQRKRFDVLPGITGLAQISGRSDLGFPETLRLDFYYIENWSPLTDIKIILKTIPKVLLARGAY